jgi:outer membrane protein TolC
MKDAVDRAVSPEGSTRVQLSDDAVRQAQARSAQARAALLPNLDSSVSQSNQTRNLAAFGIRVQLPVPGFQFPELVGPFNTFDARVTGTQSIFDFSSIRRYQSSRKAVGASEAESDYAREQVAAQVAVFYMNALAAQAHVEAAEANLELAEALARLAENRRAAGTGTAIESTRAQVQLANERQRLLVARNGRRQAELQLLRGMGVALSTEVVLTERLEYKPAGDIPVEKAVERALATRADWKAQQRREDTARLSYSGAKLERLPAVVGFADYGTIGTSAYNSSPTRTYGLSLRLPVFDGGRRDARRAESLSQMRAERVRTADLRDQVELEVRLALDSLRSAEEQVKVAEEGLTQAQREVEQAQRRYEAGVAPGLETTDAQTRLERARDNRIAALLAHGVARISLAQAMGSVREEAQ